MKEVGLAMLLLLLFFGMLNSPDESDYRLDYASPALGVCLRLMFARCAILAGTDSTFASIMTMTSFHVHYQNHDHHLIDAQT
jgi:hypothetical protein